MSETRLKISEAVNKDIELIFQYSIETFGEIVTKNYLENLHTKIRSLQAHPGKGQRHKELNSSLRFLTIGSHIIIYSFSESENLVHILRIVHKKKNLKFMDLSTE